MAKGLVDVSVTEGLNDQTVHLVLNCGDGQPSDLHSIQNGAVLYLKRGEVLSEMTVIHEKGYECSFNYIEINPNMAKKFGLKEGHRLVLDYSQDTGTIEMKRIVTSTASGYLLQEQRKNRDGVILIGYALLSQLGIPDTVIGSTITFKNGAVSKRLKVLIPENALDETFRLTQATRTAFGLTFGNAWRLAYNQTTKTLQIDTTLASIARTKKESVRKGRVTKR